MFSKFNSEHKDALNRILARDTNYLCIDVPVNTGLVGAIVVGMPNKEGCLVIKESTDRYSNTWTLYSIPGYSMMEICNTPFSENLADSVIELKAWEGLITNIKHQLHHVSPTKFIMKDVMEKMTNPSS